MRRLTLFLLVLGAGASATLAADPSLSALGALKRLPKDQAKLLARIEAREGAPVPESWHILIHDKTAPKGLREFVVSGGEVIASNDLSQFAESLAPADLLGPGAVKVDSDRAARLLDQYAQANHLQVAAVDYALKKDGAGAAPLWRLTALNAAGDPIGTLVMAAGQGTVISHEGFESEPAGAAPAAAGKSRTSARPAAGPQAPASAAARKPAATLAATPAPKPAKAPGFLQRVGGSLQKVLPGR